MQVEAIFEHPESHADRIEKPLRTTLQYLLTSIEEGRSLIAFLEQSQATRDGNISDDIWNYLDAQVASVYDSEIDIHMEQAEQEWPALSASNAWNVSRIVQQAIANAVKHASPANITVRFGWESQHTLRVEVIDDGVGFDIEEAMKRMETDLHFGLRSMRHRATMLGAHLDFESSPDEGTTVSLRLPLGAPRND